MEQKLPPLTAEVLTALLSNQEIEVAKRIAMGVPHSQIAKEMGLASSTVGTHRTRMLSKLRPYGVTDNARLAILMYQVGAVEGVKGVVDLRINQK
jgi:DNA-binding NarL/FixJ family response regulator